MRAYKGFEPNQDGALQCRDKRYAPGETYTEKSAELCRTGMHACLAPIDVLAYYPPATSVYYEVEVGDDAQPSGGGDSQVATTTLTVGAELGIAGLIRAQVEYAAGRGEPEEGGHATGDRGAASAAGNRGAASATGLWGAASATGDQGVASATGLWGVASATGDLGAASATGEHSIALAAGYQSKAKGALGCGLTLAERDEVGALIGLASVIVGREHDGQTIEPGVYYTLRAGKVVQYPEDRRIEA